MQVDINKKILVAYFSYSGNTREIANQIHKRVGGDIFEIQVVKLHPNDYDAVVKQARAGTEFRPQTGIENKNREYQVV